MSTIKMNSKHREVLKSLGLAVKNFELISTSCCNWTFRSKKTGATLNYRY